jgi:hypothetical protein
MASRSKNAYERPWHCIVAKILTLLDSLDSVSREGTQKQLCTMAASGSGALNRGYLLETLAEPLGLPENRIRVSWPRTRPMERVVAHSEEKALWGAELRRRYPDVREEDREKELELRLKRNSLRDEYNKVERILLTRNLTGRRQRLLAREMSVLYWKLARLTAQLENLNHSERTVAPRAGRIYVVMNNDGERARLECAEDPNPEWAARNPSDETESQFLTRLPVGSKWPIAEMTLKRHIQQFVRMVMKKEFREVTRLQRKADELE